MRREHIASPRSPPGRGLVTDAGRRPGDRFGGGRSVQKGELNFKPMFNKKNIAKLLVFAMILAMLPVSAVAVPSAGTAETPATENLSYTYSNSVTVSGVKVGNNEATYSVGTDGVYWTVEDAVTVSSGSKARVEFKVNLPKGATSLVFSNPGMEYKTTSDTSKGVFTYEINNDESLVYTVQYDVTVEADKTDYEQSFTITPTGGSIPNNTSHTFKVKFQTTTSGGEQPGEATYQITLDASKLYDEEEGSYVIAKDAKKSMTAIVSYTIGEDAEPEYVVGADVAWTLNPADSDVVTLGTPSKTNTQGESSVEVTGAKAGTVTVKAAWTNVSNGETKEATCTVKVTEATTYTVQNDFGEYKDYAYVTYADACVDLPGENGVYTVLKDTVKFSIGLTDATYKLKEDSVAVYKLDADTNTYDPADPYEANLEADDDNLYSFTMPNSNVVITAEFERNSFNVDVEMDIKDMKVGYALPTAIAKTEGYTVTAVHWFKDGVEVFNYFPEVGTYTFTIEATGPDGEPLGSNAIYMLDNEDTSTIEVPVSARMLSVEMGYDDNTTAGGTLTINGTSGARYYMITEKTAVEGTDETATGYLIIPGENGKLEIPCVPGVMLDMWEMAGKDIASIKAAKQFVTNTEAAKGTVLEETPAPAVTPSEPSELSAKEAVATADEDAEAGSLTVKMGYDDNTTAGGTLTINGTSSKSYYMITEKTAVEGTDETATAYIIIKGEDGKLEIPCVPGVMLDMWVMGGKDIDSIKAAKQFVVNKEAAKGSIHVEEGVS